MKKLLILLFVTFSANAATVWTVQDGVFQKLKSAAGKVKYIKLEGVKLVPMDAEIVQQGYKQVPIDTVLTGNVIPHECEAKFYCDAKWGVIFDLTKNTALQCPKAFIKKNEALLFDAAISIDNKVTCAN